jgi:hypothetical protein
MECKSQLSEPDIFETESNPLSFGSLPETNPIDSSVFRAFRRQLMEFGFLFVAFVKLYFQARFLMVQNYILNCKLRMWEAVFLYLRVQIFLTRLAQGIPVGQCWPRK